MDNSVDKMKFMLYSLIPAAVCTLLSACTQDKPAEVVYKGSNHYENQVETAVMPVEVKDTPSLVITKRESADKIYVADNFSAKPVENEAEFRRVIEHLKEESAKSDTPITLVAVPVAKPMPMAASNESAQPEIAEYGARGLQGVKPLDKPVAPQWYAQRGEATNVTEGFIWPVRGKILSTYGAKQNGSFNDGINIAAPEGKDVLAVADGEVVYAGNELEGYGNMLIVRHNNGWFSAYAHVQKMDVGLGSRVAQGQAIAAVGHTGDVGESQLHFGLRKDKQAVNPMDFLTDNFAANY